MYEGNFSLPYPSAPCVEHLDVLKSCSWQSRDNNDHLFVSPLVGARSSSKVLLFFFPVMNIFSLKPELEEAWGVSSKHQSTHLWRTACVALVGLLSPVLGTLRSHSLTSRDLPENPVGDTHDISIKLGWSVKSFLVPKRKL